MNSIKNKLILFITGSIFFVSISFGVISYMQAKRVVMGQTNQSFVEFAEEMARGVEANMRVNITVMESLRERKIIDDNSPWEGKLEILQKEARRAGFDSFGLADSSGNVISFVKDRNKVNVSDRPYFIRALSGVSAYSEVLLNRLTGQPTTIIAVPVIRNGAIKGVLIGQRNGNELSDYVNKVKIGKTGYAYMAGKDGAVIAHRNSKLVLERFNPIKAVEQDKSLEPLAAVVKKMIHGETGVANYFFAGKDRYSSFAPIPGTDGWSIAVAMDLDEILEGVHYLRNAVIAISILFLITGIAFAFFIGAGIAGPIIAAVSHAEVMATLDLTTDVPDVFLNRKDEIGKLAHAFNTLVFKLRETISGVIISAEQVSSASEQIGNANENLSQRTSEQASSLEEISATIEETNSSTKQNSENAAQASRLANITLKLAENGGVIVGEAVDSIGEINSSSARIADITSMINEIAFQTNLLALNAAVEAARAGEQGRGFAVVAGEVRNLAQRSGEASKEIGSLIKDSLSKIGTGTELVNKSGEALKEIIESVKQVSNIVSEMAASSEEQSRGVEQISIAVIEMDTMTQHNAALVEETASSSEELANQAQELLLMIQQFKLDDNFKKDVLN